MASFFPLFNGPGVLNTVSLLNAIKYSAHPSEQHIQLPPPVPIRVTQTGGGGSAAKSRSGLRYSLKQFKRSVLSKIYQFKDQLR